MTIYKTLSKGEAELLNGGSDLRGSVFTSKEAEAITGSPNRASRLLLGLKKKNWIDEIEKGKYILLVLKGPESVDSLEIASHILTPSYVSFWSALRFYDLTDQLPRTVFVAATRSKPALGLSRFSVRFVYLPPSRFFGYKKISSDNKEIFIAEKEKAIVDSLYLPRWSGGVGEVSRAISEGNFNTKKLIDYAIRMNSKSLLGRLGYLFERKGVDPYKYLGPHLGDAYVRLDPRGGLHGKTDSKWRLLINNNY